MHRPRDTHTHTHSLTALQDASGEAEVLGPGDVGGDGGRASGQEQSGQLCGVPQRQSKSSTALPMKVSRRLTANFMLFCGKPTSDLVVHISLLEVREYSGISQECATVFSHLLHTLVAFLSE